jgi:hypothetical protein
MTHTVDFGKKHFVVHGIGATLCALFIALICGYPAIAQDDTPMVDTFGSTGSPVPNTTPGEISDPIYSANPAVSAYGMPAIPTVNLPYVLTPQIDTNILWQKVTDDVNKYRASLPKDPHVLIGMLKGLIQERVDKWGVKISPWDRARWDGYCDAILRKLPNDKCEYA